jgi:hypothetical protein
MATKVGAEIKSFLDREVGKVLASECNDFTLCDEPCEFVLAGLVQRGELDAANFGADGWCQVCYLSLGGKQVIEGCVCILAMFDMFEWL